MNTRWNVFGFDVMLLDTAGIRKRSKVNEDIGFCSVICSIRAIEESDVCFLMMDAQDGCSSRIAHPLHHPEERKRLVVLVNKWDRSRRIPIP
ncbi:MAG: hypothetical protein IPI72_11520 [Flavobacteriales bacterium]|nr:hypothetical protein [Flavobacteriales bacterium]